MPIKYGYSRFVILHGGYAYKVARIRPLRTLFLIVDKLMFSLESVSDYRRRKNASSILAAVMGHIFVGIRANRSELKYWQETQDSRCVPVVSVWLGGMVIVQPRAEEVTWKEVKSSLVGELLSDRELSRSCQYGRHDGECRVLDYAHWGMVGYP